MVPLLAQAKLLWLVGQQHRLEALIPGQLQRFANLVLGR